MGVDDLPVPPPVAPMLATLGRALPVGDLRYEPKWDGFRCLAFRAGTETLLSSRNQRPLDRYFPELVEGLAGMGAARFVLDGEIVVAGAAGLDFAALMLRLHPSPSRVARLRSETPASFVAFDLLALCDRDLRAAPYVERRARLEEVMAGTPPLAEERGPLAVTPATEDRSSAVLWLDRPAGTGVDGVVVKEAASPYEAGRRARSWVKVKPERTADCVVGGVRWTGDEPVVASLLLGVYDAAGELRHTGVASSFSGAQRRRLGAAVRPYVTTLAGHPWERGFALERGPMGRLKGAAGSWDPVTMEQDWVPLRPELVCEVAYDHLDPPGRWRHPTRFRRWRPDRGPRSCTFDQFGRPASELPVARLP